MYQLAPPNIGALDQTIETSHGFRTSQKMYIRLTAQLHWCMCVKLKCTINYIILMYYSVWHNICVTSHSYTVIGIKCLSTMWMVTVIILHSSEYENFFFQHSKLQISHHTLATKVQSHVNTMRITVLCKQGKLKEQVLCFICR